jgi:hypothetical protein
MRHTFHIPVLGLGYSIDTPLKVARFGISSVVSIVDDELTERMRQYHAKQNAVPYVPILKSEEDSRARRITAYLNLLDDLVKQQLLNLKIEKFLPGTDLTKYFELLPDTSSLKKTYLNMLEMQEGAEKLFSQKTLRNAVESGRIDVNIMSKVDKANYNANAEYTGDDFTDAIAAMRGFARSRLKSAVVISAGLNPRLYAYMEQCAHLYPVNGLPLKKIILKVSDFRSAHIQAKMLAKKGLWVSEFRIESGLNCGGHAFATDGFLMGPVLEEFKQKRHELQLELQETYRNVLAAKNMLSDEQPQQLVTVQGGIGTAEEHEFLLNHYNLDAAGWGSPFLMVPEATNVDAQTLDALITADKNDFYLSNASPLGILFNNFKKSSAEDLRLQRIDKGRPGSPCKKKFLCTNTEFTIQPICTASRKYQHLKIEQLNEQHLPLDRYQQQFEKITEKVCLCEGLCASAFIKYDLLKPKESNAVSICPGPNLAYFSNKYSLSDMIGHIYGRKDLLSGVTRSNLFINELNLYLDYLKQDINAQVDVFNDKKIKYFNKFSNQLQEGINYYKTLLPGIKLKANKTIDDINEQLKEAELLLSKLTAQIA